MNHGSPRTQILHSIEGARQARGLAVIIDVFRAFSVTCYAFANGAERIISVADVEQARTLRQQHPEFMLVGERKGDKPPDFDCGNSPAEMEALDLNGKTIIHTTTNGTQGPSNATEAQEVITGSFVNAAAIVAYIKARKPDLVSLVAMGSSFGAPAEEDTLCAEYLRASLAGNLPDFAAIKEQLRHSDSAKIFFAPDLAWAPERDFELCLSLNKFDFVLRAQAYQDDLLAWRKIPLDSPPG